jgi:hypothetical protein
MAATHESQRAGSPRMPEKGILGGDYRQMAMRD